MRSNNDKKKYIQEINLLCDLIADLDGLRSGFYVSPQKIDKRISRIKIARIRSIWKRARKEILELGYGLSKRGSFRRYVFWSILLKNLAIAAVSFIGASFALAYIDPRRFGVLIDIATNPFIVVLCVILMPNAYFVVDYLARSYVREYFYSAGADKRSRVRNVINEFIKILINEVKKAGLDREKIKLKLYYTDYDNIIVIKKPSIFRRYYIALLKV